MIFILHIILQPPFSLSVSYNPKHGFRGSGRRHSGSRKTAFGRLKGHLLETGGPRWKTVRISCRNVTD